jgi:hypothetical protein
VHPTAGDLDEQENIETSKEGGIDRDEVAGDDAFSLGVQELVGAGTCRCRKLDRTLTKDVSAWL